MTRDIRAFASGLGVFVLIYAIYLALATWVREAPQPLDQLIVGTVYVAPFFAGVLCGFLSRRRQFLTLLALGVATAVCLGVLNFVWGELGFSVDLGGLRNLPWVIGLALLTMVPLVVIGGVVGATLPHGKYA